MGYLCKSHDQVAGITTWPDWSKGLSLYVLKSHVIGRAPYETLFRTIRYVYE